MIIKTRFLILLLSIAGVLTLGGFEFFRNKNKATTSMEIYEKAGIAHGKVMFGRAIDSMAVIEDYIKPGQNLSMLLSQYNVEGQHINELVRLSNQIFDHRKVTAKSKYTVICTPDSLKTAKLLVYEPNIAEYVVFDLFDSINVYKINREIDTLKKTVSGTINSSLYETLIENGATPQLVHSLAEIFAWQIDFFKVSSGDKFKIIYDEYSVKGRPLGYGNIYAAYFQYKNKDFFAIQFNQGKGKEYFDAQGLSLKRAFLKAPLKFSRISSRYSKKRFHPVQKKV